ncbi:Septation ring formation regulator EzrA [Lentibacillus sp. JNUCC-1]|uniref:septation ring formation regulator EzrA n=1 Tax=Lentibacillus sp. JNUCC-1 TaxID=2654513 RepID=UPI001321827D|nr:septation ring formation regulator EzrA [Lentibacillus sp. JNUCC-1]MUV39310.1 Septation ring formation regulator EzrA [Lentibacillus sp. JNUCC-1]
MMEFYIGIILLIIALIIFGLIMRKRIYDTVDRLEAWKLEMMNRNIAYELGQIKRLNLSGDTQERFESWKTRWESIVTSDLPNVEEYLFDAEEAADKFRFPTAKKNLRKIEQTLETAENDIEKILTELDELLETEKVSREDIEQLEPDIQDLRQTILNNRYQFGKADVRFEVWIDELRERLKDYHELVEEGNYFEAQEHVETLKADVSELQETLKTFPGIYRRTKRELPSELDDLYSGLKEMKEGGYRIEHLGFEKEIQTHHRQLLDALDQLEKGQIQEVVPVLDEIEKRIKEMYDLLEKEAVARNFVESKTPGYERLLESLDQDFRKTQEEVATLKEAYHFDDRDMERYLSLEKSINQMNHHMQAFKADKESEAHASLREQLEEGMAHIEKLQQDHKNFKETIRTLRKDEIEAKANIKEMKEKVHMLHRKLIKSNIPGVPGFIWNMMEEAMDKNDHVLKVLEKHPLDMAEVHQILYDAKQKVDQTEEQTTLVLEQAYLTERVIQYANRYRSQYPLLATKLTESERLFRSFEYELALEKAATALEEVEPGALGRIEANIDEKDLVYES